MKIALPQKKYSILYADPPWTYKAWTAKGGHKSASAHYQTLTLSQLINIPIQNICDNGILFLWSTYPNLKEAFKLMEAWGFTYKTVAFTWVKLNKNGTPWMGLGYWTRSNAEICLLGTRGNYPRRINCKVMQIVLKERREHSRKPDCVREKIVQLIGDLPRIELFARQAFSDWDSWGDEVSLFNKTED
jgi:N6-adenosine-specific RNA methylase IME4